MYVADVEKLAPPTCSWPSASTSSNHHSQQSQKKGCSSAGSISCLKYEMWFSVPSCIVQVSLPLDKEKQWERGKRNYPAIPYFLPFFRNCLNGTQRYTSQEVPTLTAILCRMRNTWEILQTRSCWLWNMKSTPGKEQRSFLTNQIRKFRPEIVQKTLWLLCLYCQLAFCSERELR